MRIRRFLLVSVLVALAGLSCSDDGPVEPPDPGSVGGVVTSTHFDGGPIQSAIVTVEGNESTSGLDGSYLIEGVTPGERVVSATRSGHHDYAATIDVTSNQLTTHDILLEPLDAILRFANGVRGTTGTVEIGLDGDPAVQVAFKSYSEYRATAPGMRVSEIADDAGTVRSGSISVAPGKHQTMVYVGPERELAAGLKLTDEPGTPAAARTLVRPVHGSRLTGPVDLYLLGPGEVVDGTPLIPGIDFHEIGEYEDLAAGEVSLVLTKVSEPDSVKFDSGPLSVPSGSAWTLLVIDGESAPDAIDLIVLEDG